MPLVILFGAILICLTLIDVLAYLPLRLLQELRPTTWLCLTLLFVVFAWCFGED